MRKITLLFITIFIRAISFAQTIPNAGFETWVNNSESPQTYAVPQGWITIDAIQTELYYLFLGDSTYAVHSVTQVGSAHGGSAAVQMRVIASNEGDTVAGAIFSEPSAIDFLNSAFGSGSIGYGFASRPANLTGFRKFTIVGGDTAIVGVVMTKWNTSTNSRDTVVNNQNYYFTTGAAAWTSFSIPLTYLYNEYPDTCVIVAGITSDRPHIGTLFTLDDLAFTGNVPIGINEQSTKNAFVSVAPNPFNNETTLSFHDVQLNHASLEVYDVLGNKVRVMNDLNGDNVIFNRDGLSDGIYFYNLVNGNEVIATGKLSIQ
jgi:hypothetical protein